MFFVSLGKQQQHHAYFVIRYPDVDTCSIEYFFVDNIRSYLALNYDLMSSHHLANSEVHHIKVR
jgi:hypothetical protein